MLTTLKNLKYQPTLITEAVRQLFIGLSLFGVFTLDETQETWLLSFVSLLLALFNWNAVMSTATVREAGLDPRAVTADAKAANRQRDAEGK
jgi:hypothetical protein